MLKEMALRMLTSANAFAKGFTMVFANHAREARRASRQHPPGRLPRHLQITLRRQRRTGVQRRGEYQSVAFDFRSSSLGLLRGHLHEIRRHVNAPFVDPQGFELQVEIETREIELNER